ncbi:FAD-dependent oxidoreductase [Herbaspirillum lusitanum]|uniref:FAD-dependent oxidoreductase n=1 Tax=Herbaspirillum lusitanum TaxID=213312 RepID=UPI00058BE84F|nr:FAD-dependent oxidoreductase [Herbaspirillum lusitanum]
MLMNNETDVLICGAGPTGLTLALVLAQRGVSFRIIEKMEAPFHGSRGKGLQPRTLEIFEDLGILETIMATGAPYPPQREYQDDGSWHDSPTSEQRLPTPSEPYLTPWMVPQFLTEAAMRTRLGELGHQVEFGCGLIGLESQEQGVNARITGKCGEQVLRARYAVAADGGRSFVRNLLQIDFPGKTLGVRAVVADVSLQGSSRDVWHRFSGGTQERQIALCPLAGTDLFQLQAALAEDEEPDLSAEGLTSMVLERTGRADIPVVAVHWASAFQMHARLAQRYRVGRVLLAGDAAHVHPPTGGQGLNTSVQDAYNLAWKLAAVLAGADETLLDTYEEERRPIAESMLGLSTRLLEEAKRGEMRRGREVQQLDLGYPGSSLALETSVREHGPRAGDRAPDAPVATLPGTPLRLFDLFRGTHWTLIGFHVPLLHSLEAKGMQVHLFGPGGNLVDCDGHFHDAYGLQRGEWMLVRPDGYIGAIVAADHLESLKDYLQRVGVSLRGVDLVAPRKSGFD